VDPLLLDLLRRLGDPREAPLADEELSQLRSSLLQTGSDIDMSNPSADDVELLGEVAQAMQVVDAELSEREQGKEDRKAEAARLAAEIGLSPDEGEETEGEAEESDASAETETEPEAVAASSEPARPVLPSMARLAAHRPNRAKPTPTATDGTNTQGKAILIAAADLPGIGAGQELNLDEFSRAAMYRFEVMRKINDPRGDGEKVYFGTIKSPAFRDEIGRNRQLTGHPDTDREIFASVLSANSLTASGGICGPVAVDYSVMTIAIADRPVQGALAQFGAARGGLRYILPHTLAQVTADGPASVWTETTDANPGASTKPHATFLCQSVQENYVDAVTAIVQFGNFQARYFPEQIQHYMETVDAVHARLADATLLAAVSNGSSRVTYGNYEVGAARDFLGAIDRASAQYRYYNRMAANAPLRLIYPAFLHDMFRTDLARNLPGDSGGQSERLAVADAEMQQWLSARNINTSPTLDSVTVGNAYSGSLPLQGWTGYPAAGGAGAQMQPWPTTVGCWLFHEGAWVVLDGGELNLGMVRDSTLNKTNDFQMFSETFEKAIFRGHASVEIDMKLDPSGYTIGTNVPTAIPETMGS
jgi:hypothetical protein